MVQVTSVFAQRGYLRSAQITGLAGSSQVDRLLLLEADKDATKFLLYGHHLKGAEVLVPSGAKLDAIGPASDADTLAMITLTADQLKLHKQLVLTRFRPTDGAHSWRSAIIGSTCDAFRAGP